MSEAEGSSSDEDEPAAQSRRAPCGQFVWPCPREFPSGLAARKSQKRLIPEDLSKAETGEFFKKTLTAHGQGGAIGKLHCFDEPHKKYIKSSQRRARHKHIIFKMNAPFAHVKIAASLASKGIHGHFSFNLVGYAAYLNYMLEPSAKKLPCDIDNDPWS